MTYLFAGDYSRAMAASVVNCVQIMPCEVQCVKLVIRRKCCEYNVDGDQHSTFLSRVLDVTESARDDAIVHEHSAPQ